MAHKLWGTKSCILSHTAVCARPTTFCSIAAYILFVRVSISLSTVHHCHFIHRQYNCDGHLSDKNQHHHCYQQGKLLLRRGPKSSIQIRHVSRHCTSVHKNNQKHSCQHDTKHLLLHLSSITLTKSVKLDFHTASLHLTDSSRSHVDHSHCWLKVGSKRRNTRPHRNLNTEC